MTFLSLLALPRQNTRNQVFLCLWGWLDSTKLLTFTLTAVWFFRIHRVRYETTLLIQNWPGIFQFSETSTCQEMIARFQRIAILRKCKPCIKSPNVQPNQQLLEIDLHGDISADKNLKELLPLHSLKKDMIEIHVEIFLLCSSPLWEKPDTSVNFVCISRPHRTYSRSFIAFT